MPLFNKFENNKALTAVLYFLLGAVVSGAAFFLVLSVNPLFVKKYVDAYRNRTAPLRGAIVDVGQANKDFQIIKFSLIIPKSLVSPAYRQAYDLVLNELQIIDDSNVNEILPLTKEVTDAFNKGNYNAVGLLMTQIGGLNSVEKDRETILANYLNNFSSVNENTTDPQVKALTNDFIAAAKALNKKYAAYGGVIDNIVVGRFNEQSLIDMGKAVRELAVNKILFVSTSNNLMNFFFKKLQGASPAASSTSR